MGEERKMRVCWRCLLAIESGDGTQETIKHYVDEEDPEESRCEWCDGEGNDILYEFV